MRLLAYLLVALLATGCDSSTPPAGEQDEVTGERDAEVRREDGAIDAQARDGRVGEVRVDAGAFDSGAGDGGAANDAAQAAADGGLDAFVEVPFGPPLARNPFAAGDGFATQHGDTGASDSSPLPGPGAKVARSTLDLLAVCPSILPRRDGLLFAVCTQIANQTPAVFLIDPDGPRTLGSRELVKGDLFGGVYPFLDAQDRVVVVDGANSLLRIAANDQALRVDEQLELGSAIAARCGSTTCDSVVGLAPDYEGNVWYATSRGVVGLAGGASVDLKEGIANSIAVAAEGTAVVTDHALYLLRASGGTPQIAMRAEYDRGSARKPGQLSWGSGSTPTFFGPRTGSEYLAITDNARPTMNLIVHRTNGDAAPVCSVPVPSPAGDGSENSPIGAGRSVFVTSTYGYPYLALPANAGTSVPDSAALAGGMARIDIGADERCELVWSNQVRSAAVPKLSIAEQRIYTVERKLAFGPGASPLDGYAYTVIDPRDGKVVASQDLPGLSDPMQLAGTLGPERTFWQGTTTGIAKLVPAP